MIKNHSTELEETIFYNFYIAPKLLVENQFSLKKLFGRDPVEFRKKSALAGGGRAVAEQSCVRGKQLASRAKNSIDRSMS